MTSKQLEFLVESPPNIGEYYNRHADTYLQKKRSKLLYFNYAIEMPANLRYLTSRFQSFKGKKVLDVGSGLGNYSKRLATLEADVTAIDISKRMHEETELACRGLPVKCLHQDFFQHCPTNGQYDLVIGGFMLGYFQDLDQAFERFRLLTTRGGVVLLSSIHPNKMPVIKDGECFTPEHYFGRTNFQTDFLDEDEAISLRRWLPSEVTESADEHGFGLDQYLEPTPALSPQDYGTQELFDFYSRQPSVAIYVLRKR